MPAEALHASVCLRHELEGLTALLQPPAPAMQGRGPSTGDSGRAGWPPVLACRSCLAPSDLFLPLLVLRLAAGLQDLLLLPWGEGVTETYPLGSVLQWLKKRKKKDKCSKTKPAAASPAPSCHGGRWEGASPRQSPLLGLVAREAKATAPGPFPATSITSAPSLLSYNF